MIVIPTLKCSRCNEIIFCSIKGDIVRCSCGDIWIGRCDPEDNRFTFRYGYKDKDPEQIDIQSDI